MERAQTSPILTLEEVTEHFQQWRNTRKSRTEQFPDRLIAEAKSLLDKYPKSDILRKLRLNRQRLLSAELPAHTPAASNSAQSTASSPFVQIPWSSPDTPTSCLEIEHPNGTTLRLHNCNEDLLSQTLNTFMDHSPCCK